MGSRRQPMALWMGALWMGALWMGAIALGLWSTSSVRAADDAPEVGPTRKSQPACILIWLEGGPPTIDMWDLEQVASLNRVKSRPIATAGGMKISEHFPQVAQVMDKLSIIRSMTTRGEVGVRASHYMQTGYTPNPNVDHPAAGSVIGRELGLKRLNLNLPAYIALKGPSRGSGFLEQRFAPLAVDDPRAFLRQADLAVARQVFERPTDLVNAIDRSFSSDRARPTGAYRQAKQQALGLLCSNQLQAFNVDDEGAALRAAYGSNDFGEGLLVARRLIEAGVPFVQVTLPGWDVRQDYFKVLHEDLFPKLDAGLSTLVRDLETRGLLEDTVVVVTGAYARSPRIRYGRRDHWSRTWSLLVGGGGIKGGMVVGETATSSRALLAQRYLPGDLWATVGHALGISLDTIYTTRKGRPSRIFNSGKPIDALLEP